jgi:para-aminobenzoate synthetase/4-amino-4-deoxychorismate lyase
LAARLTGQPSARVRVRLRRDGIVGVDVEPLPAPSVGPVLLAVDDDPVDPGDTWLYHKTSMREPYDRRRERRPDVGDVVMVNTRGELTEVTRATLALKLDGRWWTPPLESGCLPGVERARLLEARRLQERVLHLADLDQAEGAAVLSSLRGARAADLSAVRREVAPTRVRVGPERTSREVGSPVPALPGGRG